MLKPKMDGTVTDKCVTSCHLELESSDCRLLRCLKKIEKKKKVKCSLEGQTQGQESSFFERRSIKMGRKSIR